MRWRLDTCGCVLSYSQVDELDRFKDPVVEKDCGAHGQGLTVEEHFRRVLAFNRAVNGTAKR